MSRAPSRKPGLRSGLIKRATNWGRTRPRQLWLPETYHISCDLMTSSEERKLLNRSPKHPLKPRFTLSSPGFASYLHFRMSSGTALPAERLDEGPPRKPLVWLSEKDKSQERAFHIALTPGMLLRASVVRGETKVSLSPPLYLCPLSSAFGGRRHISLPQEVFLSHKRGTADIQGASRKSRSQGTLNQV